MVRWTVAPKCPVLGECRAMSRNVGLVAVGRVANPANDQHCNAPVACVRCWVLCEGSEANVKVKVMECFSWNFGTSGLQGTKGES